MHAIHKLITEKLARTPTGTFDLPNPFTVKYILTLAFWNQWRGHQSDLPATHDLLNHGWLAQQTNQMIQQITQDAPEESQQRGHPFQSISTMDFDHLDWLLTIISKHYDDENYLNQLCHHDPNCQYLIASLTNPSTVKQTIHLPVITHQAHSPLCSILKGQLTQKIITNTKESEQKMVIESVADTLLNPNNAESVKDLMIWSLASLLDGHFQIRTNQYGDLINPPQGIPAVNYLFCGSRIMATFTDTPIDNQFKQSIKRYKEDIDTHQPSNRTYSRPSTHAYDLTETGALNELKGPLLGLQAQVNNLIYDSENHGHDVLIGPHQINEVGQLPQRGSSGTCLLFQKSDDTDHVMIGFEQLGTAAHQPDKFDQQHSLIGSSDKFTAANALYGDDPTSMLKYIDDPIRSKYNGMHVTINPENFQGIEQRHNQIKQIILSTTNQAEKKRQLVELLQTEPSTAKKLDHHERAIYFHQNFVSLNLNKVWQDIDRYVIDAPDGFKTHIKQIIDHLAETKFKTLELAPTDTIQTIIDSLKHDPQLDQYPHLYQLIENFQRLYHAFQQYAQPSSYQQKLLASINALDEEIALDESYKSKLDTQNVSANPEQIVALRQAINDLRLLFVQSPSSNPQEPTDLTLLPPDVLAKIDQQFNNIKDQYAQYLIEHLERLQQLPADDLPELISSTESAKSSQAGKSMHQVLNPSSSVESDHQLSSPSPNRAPGSNPQEPNITPQTTAKRSVVVSDNQTIETLIEELLEPNLSNEACQKQLPLLENYEHTTVLHALAQLSRSQKIQLYQKLHHHSAIAFYYERILKCLLVFSIVVGILASSIVMLHLHLSITTWAYWLALTALVMVIDTYFFACPSDLTNGIINTILSTTMFAIGCWYIPAVIPMFPTMLMHTSIFQILVSTYFMLHGSIQLCAWQSEKYADDLLLEHANCGTHTKVSPQPSESVTIPIEPCC
ncbi:hypothetical protein N9Y17_03440 [Gammaproteobacteria bacterium]|nr:hypothetical protein [Gammaproteobacteria bacterium]